MYVGMDGWMAPLPLKLLLPRSSLTRHPASSPFPSGLSSVAAVGDSESCPCSDIIPYTGVKMVDRWAEGHAQPTNGRRITSTGTRKTYGESCRALNFALKDQPASQIMDVYDLQVRTNTHISLAGSALLGT